MIPQEEGLDLLYGAPSGDDTEQEPDKEVSQDSCSAGTPGALNTGSLLTLMDHPSLCQLIYLVHCSSCC